MGTLLGLLKLAAVLPRSCIRLRPCASLFAAHPCVCVCVCVQAVIKIHAHKIMPSMLPSSALSQFGDLLEARWAPFRWVWKWGAPWLCCMNLWLD